jgi:acyl dehydratase
MVSFGSASAALDAAIDIQRGLTDEFTDAQDEIKIRIGIHAGEPIAEDDDLHGTAVIMASRIMATADGDEIMVSSLVRELVAGRDYQFIGRGQRSLKGFDQPVPLFELDWRHVGPVSTAAAAALALDERIGDIPQGGEWHQLTSEQVAQYAAATTDLGANDGAVPPMLLVSLLTHLVSSVPDTELPTDGLLMGINYGFETLRFGQAVPVGSRARAFSAIKAVEQRDTAVHVTWEVSVEVEGLNDPALTAEWLIRSQYTT